ncbi:hypothetical protein DFJ73DRAFT_807641 [Zopfochytrium polystomum]|nr:hypothetical protein DFJ73DRAFT_807641 [Zopfochytrium polystomum]
MLDDDTYVYLENLAAHLAKKSLDRPVYTGLKNRFKGCDGVREFGQGPFFAHWWEWDSGDIRLALCMRDAGILLEYDEWLFHKEPYQTHHLKSTDHKRNSLTPRTRAFAPTSSTTSCPHKSNCCTPQRSARTEQRSPTFLRSWWWGPDLRYAREILKDPGLTPPSTGFAFPDEDAPGGDIKGVAVGSADGYVACSKECLAEEKCVSWSMVGETCWLKNTFSARVEKKGAWSGYLPQRYKCKV